LDQALILMRFGSSFDIQDLKYWRQTRELVENALDHSKSKQNVDIVLDIATHMKEFGMLSNKVLRHIAQHLAHISTMTTGQLSLFTMIYCSQEM